ncbi:MAG: RsmD family RNA methyltransferase [Phycisphaeraceae bacterium]|nr:MAG: RsmD family RNA methyltransferase [Phycisphaeraceae bacterium]
MFRIISGEFRRRQLLTPRDSATTRPIPDRVKESVFSLLRGHCEGAAVFDAFAGTGPIGLEALSRGASRVVMVERDREVFKLLEANVRTLSVGARCDLVLGDALGVGAAARCPRPVHLMFFDPPYPLVRDALGWSRVKAQIERLIPHLDDSGYAVLRTPWPFTHALAAEDEAEPAAEPRRKPSRREREDRADRWLTREEIARATGRPPGPEMDPGASGDDPSDEMEIDGDADFDTGDAGAVFDDPGSSEPQDEGHGHAETQRVPLDLEGATGPETHVYHSMAVHLYMKRR